MKKILKNLADSLMSKDQMKSIKGGTMYCVCNDGQTYVWPSNSGYTCEQKCLAHIGY